jgi:hypothetical protein
MIGQLNVGTAEEPKPAQTVLLETALLVTVTVGVGRADDSHALSVQPVLYARHGF